MTSELTITIPAGAIEILEGSQLDQNPAAVYLAGLQSARSRRTMRGDLDDVANTLSRGSDAFSFPWHRLRFQHVVALRSSLAEQLSAATVNKKLCAVRGVLKAAWNLGLMAAEDYQKAASVKGLKAEAPPAGRALSSGEIRALMTACMADPSPAGARDAAMLAILRICGLRRAELVNLDLADYDPERGELRVKGKGNKQRLAHVVNGATDALADWLAIRGDAPGPLFYPIRRGGYLQLGQRLTTQAVYYTVQKRAGEASVKELSPHDFRRTFVSDLLDAGADISTVQRLAGHANVTTTARYDRRPEAAKRKAAEMLHVPYRRRDTT
jgi:site-specific recombinase XerD